MRTNDAGGGAFKLERWVPSQETSFMERGDADLSVDMPFKDAAEIRKSGAYRVVRTPVENSLQYVGLVTKMKPFDDVRVRQVIAWVVSL